MFYTVDQHEFFFFFLLLQIVRWWSYIWKFPSMVQKPHRERKFTDCHLTRRKASCSFCVIPPRAFVFSQLDLSSLLFINLSSVYWVVTDSNWPAYFHSLWREAIQRLRQHIKGGGGNLTMGRWGKKSPWLWFWQLECFKLFSLLKRGSHISVWFIQKSIGT